MESKFDEQIEIKLTNSLQKSVIAIVRTIKAFKETDTPPTRRENTFVRSTIVGHLLQAIRYLTSS